MLYIVLSPGLFLIMKKGIVWRKELREKEERKKQKKQDAAQSSPQEK